MKRLRKPMAMFMAFFMALSSVNLTAFASDDAGHEHNQDGWECTWVESVTEPACAHEHTDDCYIDEEPVLICDITEHKHVPECYEAGEDVLTCEEKHEHGPECYEAGDDVLSCGLPEHEHAPECHEAGEQVLDCKHACDDGCIRTVQDGYWDCEEPSDIPLDDELQPTDGNLITDSILSTFAVDESTVNTGDISMHVGEKASHWSYPRWAVQCPNDGQTVAILDMYEYGDCYSEGNIDYTITGATSQGYAGDSYQYIKTTNIGKKGGVTKYGIKTFVHFKDTVSAVCPECGKYISGSVNKYPEFTDFWNVTVYDTFTMIFDANGGEFSTGDIKQSCEKTEAVGICNFKDVAPCPERTGFTFSGWSDNPNGSLIEDDDLIIESTVDNDKRTVYAIWTKDSSESYTITMNYLTDGAEPAVLKASDVVTIEDGGSFDYQIIRPGSGSPETDVAISWRLGDSSEYVLDEALSADALATLSALHEVHSDIEADIIYSLDVKGGNDPDVSEGGHDDVPDRYQAKVQYRSTEGGTQDGADMYATIMDNGMMSGMGTIGIAGATAASDDGYSFVGWSAEADGHEGWSYSCPDDRTIPMDTIPAKGGAVYTFTASFEEEKVPTVTKHVIVNSAFTYGDADLWVAVSDGYSLDWELSFDGIPSQSGTLDSEDASVSSNGKSPALKWNLDVTVPADSSAKGTMRFTVHHGANIPKVYHTGFGINAVDDARKEYPSTSYDKNIDGGAEYSWIYLFNAYMLDQTAVHRYYDRIDPDTGEIGLTSLREEYTKTVTDERVLSGDNAWRSMKKAYPFAGGRQYELVFYPSDYTVHADTVPFEYSYVLVQNEPTDFDPNDVKLGLLITCDDDKSHADTGYRLKNSAGQQFCDVQVSDDGIHAAVTVPNAMQSTQCLGWNMQNGKTPWRDGHRLAKDTDLAAYFIWDGTKWVFDDEMNAGNEDLKISKTGWSYLVMHVSHPAAVNYKVVREYYTGDKLDGSEEETGAGHVGDVIRASDYTSLTSYNGKEYECCVQYNDCYILQGSSFDNHEDGESDESLVGAGRDVRDYRNEPQQQADFSCPE